MGCYEQPIMEILGDNMWKFMVGGKVINEGETVTTFRNESVTYEGIAMSQIGRAHV